MVADGNGPHPAAERFTEEPADLPTGFAAVALRFNEVVEFAAYYIAAQADRLKLTAINIAMFVILGAIGAFVGTAVVLTAGVLLVVGVAGGLGTMFGGRFWLGDLVTALVIVGGLFAGTIIVFKKVTGSTRGKLVAAYEQRKSRQRSTLGTDVKIESER